MHATQGFSNIVVGVDGTDTAKLAATKAARLAVATGANLLVVTAFGSSRAEGALAGAANEWLRDAERAAASTADSTADELVNHFPDLAVSTVAAHGKPHVVLTSEANRLAADLIVVGNRRMQGMQRVLGSVASAVAHNAACDVYIAHTTSARD